MINAIASSAGFIVLITFFLGGAIGSFCCRKNDAVANGWSHFFALAGSGWGIAFAVSLFFIDHPVTFSVVPATFPLLVFSFYIDRLAAFFVFTISLITFFSSVYGIGYVRHFYKKYNIGALGFFYHLFIMGMMLVVTCANGLFFLVAWEIMSIASYFLVVYDRKEPNNIKAGFLYIVMTHVGTAFIVIAFLMLYRLTGSFDFAAIKSGIWLVPWSVKNTVFVLMMIGFGTKAGIIPLHIWLPSAHPAAPSHVSALMSGVMIKTGIYMMIRMFLDLLWPAPVWWGFVILMIGSVSALLGVLYALMEHDLKRLLAYHSIENIGIILLGLGSALTFLSLGKESLALLGFAAALFHTLNHATFKSLLFLGAGSVVNQTHTHNMEDYGGLIRYMPQTAFFFLVGSMAISALPPFNGFFSEWLTFQSLFQGILDLDLTGKFIFMLGASALVLTGGLALACFVKAFGATFLARPRGAEVIHARESSPSLLVGMGSLAALCLLFGILSKSLIIFFEKIGNDLVPFRGVHSFVSSSGQTLIVGNGFASVSAPIIFVFLVVIFLFVFLLIRFVVNKNQKVYHGPTWDCGTSLTPRMEITATGFARSLVLVFRGVLKPSLQHEVEYHDAESRYLPKSVTVGLGARDVYQSYFYEPLRKIMTTLSLHVKNIQTGNVNVYILYIFIALIVLVFFI